MTSNERNNMKYYNPREITELNLIHNTRGEASYWYVLRLIKAKQLKAKNSGLGKTPYWQVSEEEIERFNKEGTKV